MKIGEQTARVVDVEAPVRRKGRGPPATLSGRDDSDSENLGGSCAVLGAIQATSRSVTLLRRDFGFPFLGHGDLAAIWLAVFFEGRFSSRTDDVAR